MAKYSKVPFTEIATLIRGVSYDKSLSSLTKKDGYTPILRANNIQKDLVLADLVYVPSRIVKEEQKIRKGDIILAMSSGSKDLVGKSAQAQENLDAAFGTFCGLIRAKENIDSKFLGLFFQTQEYRNFVSYLSKGVNICNLKKKDIESLQIPLPPLATQHAIVSRIESLFAELDKGVEKLKTAQQQLKVYRQAVLNDCLTKGSEKWEKVKLKDICLSISDGDHLPPKRTDKGVPFITISDIKGNSIDFSNVSYMTEEYYENLSQSRKAMVGDILYTVTGSYGIPVLVENNIKFCFQRHIGLIRPNSTIVMQRWLYYMMQSPIIYSQATEKSTGTAQKTVTLSVLRDFELCLPPLPIQQRIVQEIETRLSQAELVEASIEQSLQQAEALRQSILKKAFSGELV